MESTATTRAWVPSRFNTRLDREGEVLYFNSVTAHLLRLNKSASATLDRFLRTLGESGSCSNPLLLDHLVLLGFVVQKYVDEFEHEHSRFLAVQKCTDRLLVTIAPTMGCNLHCSYCFQKNLAKYRPMSPEVVLAVQDFVIAKSRGCRRVVVQWFGGEPLLALATLERLSEAFISHCDRNGIHYHAEMLSNGVKLSPDVVRTLGRMRVRALQIPLDGRPETYAERKEVPVARAEAIYDNFVRLMPGLLDATGSVTVRINVDRDNIAEAKDVVKMFSSRGVVDNRIDFRLGYLNVSRGLVDCIPHNCFTGAEFSEAERDFRRFLADCGYRVYGMPLPIDYPCMAAVYNSYTIDPLGRIGKCVPSTGSNETVFSTVFEDKDGGPKSDGNVPLGRFDPFLARPCRDCSLLPLCLGSCPKMHMHGMSPDCSVKHGLAECLAFYDGLTHPVPRVFQDPISPCGP